MIKETFTGWFWSAYRAKKDSGNMCAYITEKITMDNKNCSDIMAVPSKRLMRRYGIKYGSEASLIFAILEKHFEPKA